MFRFCFVPKYIWGARLVLSRPHPSSAFSFCFAAHRACTAIWPVRFRFLFFIIFNGMTFIRFGIQWQIILFQRWTPITDNEMKRAETRRKFIVFFWVRCWLNKQQRIVLGEIESHNCLGSILDIDSVTKSTSDRDRGTATIDHITLRSTCECVNSRHFSFNLISSSLPSSSRSVRCLWKFRTKAELVNEMLLNSTVLSLSLTHTHSSKLRRLKSSWHLTCAKSIDTTNLLPKHFNARSTHFFLTTYSQLRSQRRRNLIWRMVDGRHKNSLFLCRRRRWTNWNSLSAKWSVRSTHDTTHAGHHHLVRRRTNVQ